MKEEFFLIHYSSEEEKLIDPLLHVGYEYLKHKEVFHESKRLSF